jgi:hypothetical protein
MSIFSDCLVGGRGKAVEFIVAGASDAHKKVIKELIRDRLDHCS